MGSRWVQVDNGVPPPQVTVLFAGQQIPKSPFEVSVDKALGDASKVTVKGPGVEPVGNVANKPTYFSICTAGQRRRRLLRGVPLKPGVQIRSSRAGIQPGFLSNPLPTTMSG